MESIVTLVAGLHTAVHCTRKASKRKMLELFNVAELGCSLREERDGSEKQCL
uniref:Uncharacterized protein n=1 Tax=Physcomitrium patens TaxID=3218 RepID=A0A7I4E9E2_PHYPA